VRIEKLEERRETTREKRVGKREKRAEVFEKWKSKTSQSQYKTRNDNHTTRQDNKRNELGLGLGLGSPEERFHRFQLPRHVLSGQLLPGQIKRQIKRRANFRFQIF
jgi:hypothetical protein